ncbi:hypothetical protein [Streptomyces sp. NBC_01483]|uniref:hypothetical protein n=1 Tax=Streptomyces sp. NBC_01483 TaxID=2903883 RepID=UPI002E3462E9|nr:hypothetical protein [Streptomyces sp. NBC_01483]
MTTSAPAADSATRERPARLEGIRSSLRCAGGRVTALGGRLLARPRAEGGFTGRAEPPWEPTP